MELRGKTMVLILIILKSMKRKRSTKVRGTPSWPPSAHPHSPPLPFPLIVDAGITISTAIGQATIIRANGAELFIFKCQLFSSNATLLTQLMVGILWRVKWIAHIFELGAIDGDC